MHLQSNIKIYYKALPLQSNNEFKKHWSAKGKKWTSLCQILMIIKTTKQKAYKSKI